MCALWGTHYIRALNRYTYAYSFICLNEMNLTITIPTYNRLEQLRITCSALLPQLCEGVSILIIDNNSDTPVTLEGLQIHSSYSNKVRILHNRLNIGAIGNVLRCIEICETEYIWILADDDVVPVNSIEIIRSEIMFSPNAINYNFSVLSDRKFERIISNGINDFIDKIESWGETISLSGNVYNCRKMQMFISQGYVYGYSYAPHVAILLEILRVLGGEVVFSSKKIITGNQPGCTNPSWSAVDYILKRFSILDIPIDPDKRLILGRKITTFAGMLNTPFVFFCYDSKNDTSGSYKYIMADIVSRSFRYLTFKSKLKAITFKVLMNFPLLMYAIMIKFFPKNKILGIVNREHAVQVE